MMMDPDRRRFERYVIQVPIDVSTKERPNRGGMICDVSAGGLLFHSVSSFDIGERLTVRFQIGGAGSTTARVVRTYCDLNADNRLRFVTAVEFDLPLSDLEISLGRDRFDLEEDTDPMVQSG